MSDSDKINLEIQTDYVKNLIKTNTDSKYVEEIRLIECIEFGFVAGRYVSYVRKKLQEQYPNEFIGIQEEMKSKNKELLFVQDNDLSVNEIIKRDSLDTTQLNAWEEKLRESINESLC